MKEVGKWKEWFKVDLLSIILVQQVPLLVEIVSRWPSVSTSVVMWFTTGPITRHTLELYAKALELVRIDKGFFGED